MTCAIHNWQYQGTVYWSDKKTFPGSGAHARIYRDKYFCAHCLETRITNERAVDSNYGKPLPNTLPR